MANFIISYNKTLIDEGKYSNVSADKGGETWKGIARNIHKSWEGWKIIDRYKSKPDFPKSLEYLDELELLVLEFYQKNFWNIIKGGQILSQEIADSLFNSAVNFGPVRAIKLAQNSLFKLSDRENRKQEEIRNLRIKYGEIDIITLNKLNNV